MVRAHRVDIMKACDCPMLSEPVLAPGGQDRLRRRSGDTSLRLAGQQKHSITHRARGLDALLAASSARNLIRSAMQSASEGVPAC